ncbi:MAG: Lrp/AsnC family transcriptional regulator [Synergistaceae bacterium]|nr:Lrp/AsnC family transcriptional regulator [Synergistaceae bacterium]
MFSLNNSRLLDEKGREIVKILQEDARISFNELARRTGLSSPAVADRVRKLERAGIITGYSAVVNPLKVGYSIMAFIRLNSSAAYLAKADDIAQTLPEVLECHHLTGSDGVMLKVVVASVSDLESIVTKFADCGISTTSIALSSPISGRVIVPA